MGGDNYISKTASESTDSNLPTFRRWNDMFSEAFFIYKMKDTTNKPAKQNFVF
jgi:hypothetical protein